MGGFGFTFARTDGFPTRYPDLHPAVNVDVPLAGIITAFVIFGLSLLAIIPAYNTFSKKAFIFTRIICTLSIGGIILAGGLYGHNWERAIIRMSAPYKPGIPDEIQGTLGLHIGLRGINVTLVGKPFPHHGTHGSKQNATVSPLAGETINYNEHFSWEWAQGRFGFGKYAGRISREFREGVLTGLPLPILQVAEYFTFDGEGIRFGRHYRHAGWYSHLILWFAFGTWLISNILFCMVISTATLFLFFTGCLQLAAIGVWTFIRNSVELQIPFQSDDGKRDIIMQTHYWLDYYLVFANGIFCIVLSALIALINEFKPDEMCQWFGIDPLTIYDDVLLSKEEIKEENRRMSILRGEKFDIEMEGSDVSSQPSGGLQVPGDDGANRGGSFLRKRSNKASFLIRQSIRQIKPRVPRRQKEQTISDPRNQDVRRPLLQTGGGFTSDSDDGGSSNYGANLYDPGTSSKLAPQPPPKPQSPM